MISYRVKLEDDEGTVLVTSPDFPELVTFGDDVEDALSYAIGAFQEAIAARISDRKEIPEPSRDGPSRKRGRRLLDLGPEEAFSKSLPMRWVSLPVQTAVKVLLYQQMWKSGLRKADLARKMNLHRQEIDRLFDLNHATSLDKIEKAFAALGKTLDIAVADAP